MLKLQALGANQHSRMLTSHRLLSVGRLPVVQLTPVFHHRAHTMSLFGYIGVEEPKFTLREKKQLYEIRTYAPQLRAEVGAKLPPSGIIDT